MYASFLTESAPHAFVTEPSADQRARSLFKEAQKRGIRCVALQWALHTDLRKRIKRSLYSRLLVVRDQYGSLAKAPIVVAYYKLLYALFIIINVLSGGDRYIHKDYHMDKLGTIDDTLRDYFHWRGWRDDQIEIVGSADYSLIGQMVASVRTDESLRRQLLQKYTLAEDS